MRQMKLRTRTIATAEGTDEGVRSTHARHSGPTGPSAYSKSPCSASRFMSGLILWPRTIGQKSIAPAFKRHLRVRLIIYLLSIPRLRGHEDVTEDSGESGEGALLGMVSGFVHQNGRARTVLALQAHPFLHSSRYRPYFDDTLKTFIACILGTRFRSTWSATSTTLPAQKCPTCGTGELGYDTAHQSIDMWYKLQGTRVWLCAFQKRESMRYSIPGDKDSVQGALSAVSAIHATVSLRVVHSRAGSSRMRTGWPLSRGHGREYQKSSSSRSSGGNQRHG
ncbi:hypothetical protein OBBRIDRAFT_823788 [Obba rivulosa]|uniref:Uncharacterized protein n=1 Tax=Obba rivulosa TaxID=1052685 RepID=A0A8E2DQN7_9APHY|nr:hypothetical protein OBBRIDRAFT_823788 [Obba rivulosa]